MSDIKSPTLLAIKGGLMLAVGILAAVLVWAEAPSLRNGVLLGIALWGFCRAYYFAFYVVEHYIDPSFKFAGLTSVFSYWLKNRKREKTANSHAESSIES